MHSIDRGNGFFGSEGADGDGDATDAVKGTRRVRRNTKRRLRKAGGDQVEEDAWRRTKENGGEERSGGGGQKAEKRRRRRLWRFERRGLTAETSPICQFCAAGKHRLKAAVGSLHLLLPRRARAWLNANRFRCRGVRDEKRTRAGRKSFAHASRNGRYRSRLRKICLRPSEK